MGRVEHLNQSKFWVKRVNEYPCAGPQDEYGLAAEKASEVPNGPWLVLLRDLQGYRVFDSLPDLVTAPSFCAWRNACANTDPRRARHIATDLCERYLKTYRHKQILITTYAPTFLDGLPLHDDRVRLFSVNRSNYGVSCLHHVRVDADMLKRAEEGLTFSRLWMMGHLGGIWDG